MSCLVKSARRNFIYLPPVLELRLASRRFLPALLAVLAPAINLRAGEALSISCLSVSGSRTRHPLIFGTCTPDSDRALASGAIAAFVLPIRDTLGLSISVEFDQLLTDPMNALTFPRNVSTRFRFGAFESGRSLDVLNDAGFEQLCKAGQHGFGPSSGRLPRNDILLEKRQSI